MARWGGVSHLVGMPPRWRLPRVGEWAGWCAGVFRSPDVLALFGEVVRGVCLKVASLGEGVRECLECLPSGCVAIVSSRRRWVADTSSTMAKRRPFTLLSLDLPAHLQSEERELLRIKISTRVARLVDVVAASLRCGRGELVELAIARLCGDAEVFCREAGDILPRVQPPPGNAATNHQSSKGREAEEDTETDDKAAA